MKVFIEFEKLDISAEVDAYCIKTRDYQKMIAKNQVDLMNLQFELCSERKCIALPHEVRTHF
jgi:hypothetical protein